MDTIPPPHLPLWTLTPTQEPSALKKRLAGVDAQIRALKKKRPNPLTEEQKLDILMVYHLAEG
jgi:hypothetical protein